MEMSAARVALPPFDTNELFKLIKRIVMIEKRWIPAVKGHSLYIRPTIIGTRDCKLPLHTIFLLLYFSREHLQLNACLLALGVAASDRAMLYIILGPTGPFFRTGARPVALLAVQEHVRAWPGGTGGYKLALNYAPTFKPQQAAAKLGYDQCLWLIDDTVTEAGAMNFFVVVKRDDGGAYTSRSTLSPTIVMFSCGWLNTDTHVDADLDVITPPLDGTILPGVTRDSTIGLCAAHASRTTLPGLPASTRLHVAEQTLTMSDLAKWAAESRLLEAFTVGTAVVVAAVGRIGFNGTDIVLPEYEGVLGPVARGLYDRLTDIQEGKFEWEDWSVPCA